LLSVNTEISIYKPDVITLRIKMYPLTLSVLTRI